VTFRYQSSFWEHYWAYAAVLLRIRSQLLGFIFVAVGGVFLIGIHVALSVSDRSSGVAIGLCFVLLFPSINALQVWAARRKNRLVGGQLTFSLDDDAIRMSGALWDVTVRWDAIIRHVETRSFLLFYYAPRFAFWLPKRVLTAEELASIRALVAERVKKSNGSPTHIDLA
jgi:hypothetical protein